MDREITAKQYLDAAFREYHRDGEIEIDIPKDEEAQEVCVSRGADPGAYVRAWVWVSDDEVE